MWKKIRYEIKNEGRDCWAVLDRFGILYPPIDIIKIIRRLGGKVLSYSNLGHDGVFQFNEDGNFSIWVEDNHHINIQRLTVAYMFGKLMLCELENEWRDNIDESYIICYGSIKAYSFAKNILIPDAMLEASMYSFSGKTVGELSLKYQVSDYIMREKLVKLGYLN